MLRHLTLISQVGFAVFTPIALLTYIGDLLDKGLKTSFFILVFLLFGVASGAWSAYRLLRSMIIREAAEDKKEKERERAVRSAHIKIGPPIVKPKKKSRIFKEKDIEQGT